MVKILIDKDVPYTCCICAKNNKKCIYIEEHEKTSCRPTFLYVCKKCINQAKEILDNE